MFQRFVLLFNLIIIPTIGLFFSFNLQAQSASLPENIRGALCLVRADEQIVLVSEKITGKLSLPGGGISSNEPASAAAEREAWEETGLVVTAKEVIGYTDTAVIFDCVSESEVVAYDFLNRQGGYVLPIWFAPHYGIETNFAMLIDPTRVDATQYRYEAQWRAIGKMFAIATEQPTLYISDLMAAAPTIHQREIAWIRGMQNGMNVLPDTLYTMVDLVLLTGDVFGQAWLILILFPLLFALVKKHTALKVLFVFVCTSLLTLVAKQGFSLPPPYAYLPELQRLPDVGLSFPNTIITLWVSCSLVLLSDLKVLYWNKFSALIVVIGAWFGLSQIYSGVAYFSDIAVGVILGGLIAWHVERLERKPDIDLDNLLGSKSLWIGIAIICALLTVVWPQPIFTQWLGAAMVIAVLFCLPSVSFSCEGRSLIPLIISIGLMVASSFALNHLKIQLNYSSLYALIIDTLHFPLMAIIWLSVYVDRLKKH